MTTPLGVKARGKISGSRFSGLVDGATRPSPSISTHRRTPGASASHGHARRIELEAR